MLISCGLGGSLLGWYRDNTSTGADIDFGVLRGDWDSKGIMRAMKKAGYVFEIRLMHGNFDANTFRWGSQLIHGNFSNDGMYFDVFDALFYAFDMFAQVLKYDLQKE